MLGDAEAFERQGIGDEEHGHRPMTGAQDWWDHRGLVGGLGAGVEADVATPDQKVVSELEDFASVAVADVERGCGLWR